MVGESRPTVVAETMEAKAGPEGKRGSAQGKAEGELEMVEEGSRPPVAGPEEFWGRAEGMAARESAPGGALPAHIPAHPLRIASYWQRYLSHFPAHKPAHPLSLTRYC